MTQATGHGTTSSPRSKAPQSSVSNLSAEERLAPPDPAVEEPVVRVAEARKVYYKPDGSILVEALRGVTVEVYRGEYVAIMGASGSGKSTLMNLLGCLDRPTRGDYFLDGFDVSRMDDEHLSRVRGQRIGFVFQAFNLISALTVLENVQVPLFYQGVPRHTRHDKATRTLELVGLGDRMGHRPSELSGGQQQRVAIARALVNDPAIILADEPTGNLDSATGQSILALFDQLHRNGLTILMVTHDNAMADRAERVVRLRDGLLEYDRVYRRRGILRGTNFDPEVNGDLLVTTAEEDALAAGRSGH